MLNLAQSTQFKKDFRKLLAKNPSFDDLKELYFVIEQLVNQIPLDKKYEDHPLKNDKQERRDCHVQPDLVLLYKKDKETITLARIGSHSYLGI
jgi:mRNA interferase YafQ